MTKSSPSDASTLIERSRTVLIVLTAVLLRIMIGHFPYSGEYEPPRMGDFEAQRHWMEITLNLPAQEWYVDSEINDPKWWPLDYPPLTAYHEFVIGHVSRIYEPASIELGHSRGYETDSHRWFMRLTVLLSDLIVYFPAAWLVYKSKPTQRSRMKLAVLAGLLLNPVLIYVDHAHFQYNSVALGLVLYGAAAVMNGRVYLGAICYTLSFMFKQTMLYFAPAFFAFMLGQALHLRSPAAAVRRVVLLGVAVLLTVSVVLVPVIADCRTGDCLRVRLRQILERVFPFWRGIFEDYVANFWVAISPVLRLRTAPDNFIHKLRSLSGICTLVTSVVPCWSVLRRPAPERFPTVLAAVSLSFYLFSWLVHEKAIVLPLTAIFAGLPFLMDMGLAEVVSGFIQTAFLSCYPLIVTEKSTVGTTAVFILGFFASMSLTSHKRTETHDNTCARIQKVFNITGACSVLGLLYIQPPPRFPFLWQLIIAESCFASFSITWMRLLCVLRRNPA